MIAAAPTTDLSESCSRDPIGYEDGLSLYQSYFVMCRVDPWGLCGVDCKAIYNDKIKEINDTFDLRFKAIQEQTVKLGNAIIESSEKQHDVLMNAADKGDAVIRAGCGKFDRNTYSGMAAYYACVWSNNAGYSVTTSATWTIESIALLDVTAAAATFETGQMAGLTLWSVTQKAGAFEAYKECLGRGSSSPSGIGK